MTLMGVKVFVGRHRRYGVGIFLDGTNSQGIPARWFLAPDDKRIQIVVFSKDVGTTTKLLDNCKRDNADAISRGAVDVNPRIGSKVLVIDADTSERYAARYARKSAIVYMRWVEATQDDAATLRGVLPIREPAPTPVESASGFRVLGHKGSPERRGEPVGKRGKRRFVSFGEAQQ